MIGGFQIGPFQTDYQQGAFSLLVPNVVGLVLNVAEPEMNAVTGYIEQVIYQDTIFPVYPESGYPRGTVLVQYPVAGTPVMAPFPYILICSSGLMYLPKVTDSIDNPVNVVIGSTAWP